MKWLKEILGNEEIEDKLDTINKELPKHFIPKDKFNEQGDKLKEKETELAEVTKQLESVNSQVSELAKTAEENQELKGKLDSINAEYEQFQADADKRLVDVKKKQAIERGLRDANANPDTIDLLIEKFNFDEIELDDKENVKDFSKHLEPLKEQRKSLFAETNITGDEPPVGTPPKVTSLSAQYEAAKKEGRSQDAIAIKLEAARKGEAI